MGGLRNYTVMNSKGLKLLQRIVEEQWGTRFPAEFVYMLSSKNKIYAAHRDLFSIQLDALNINNAGLYVGEQVDESSVRLSIEGAQLIGGSAAKGVIEISADDAAKWLAGEDLAVEPEVTGYVLLKKGNDFLGCGKASNGKLLNFVPKARRIELM